MQFADSARVDSVPGHVDWEAEGLLEDLPDDRARNARRELNPSRMSMSSGVIRDGCTTPIASETFQRSRRIDLM